MQKQPNRPYRVFHDPIALPADFPVVGQFHFQQGDAPIRWLHVHDCLELGYCYEGAGVFVIGNKVLRFRAGDVSVITSAEVHLAQSIPGTTSRWAWIYLDPFRLLRMTGNDTGLLALGNLTGARFRNLISPPRDPFVGPLVRELATELKENAGSYQTAVKGLVATLMVRLQRLAPKRKMRSNVGELEPAMRRIAPALDLMAESYMNETDVRMWARKCHVSVTHFRRLFQRALGKSPHQYLIELRVSMAASRLQATDEKVVDIAHEAGFGTLSSFNRSFRHVMHITPRQWRMQK